MQVQPITKKKHFIIQSIYICRITLKEVGVQMVVVGTKEMHDCKEEKDNLLKYFLKTLK